MECTGCDQLPGKGREVDRTLLKTTNCCDSRIGSVQLLFVSELEKVLYLEARTVELRWSARKVGMHFRLLTDIVGKSAFHTFQGRYIISYTLRLVSGL